MALSIGGVTHPDPATVRASKTPVAAQRGSAQKSSQARASAQANLPQDTVQISSAAQAAFQEATETPAQTTKEAQGGDQQAVRLLAKEAAAKRAQP